MISPLTLISVVSCLRPKTVRTVLWGATVSWVCSECVWCLPVCPGRGGSVPGLPPHRELPAVVLLPALLRRAAARGHHLRGLLHRQQHGQPGEPRPTATLPTVKRCSTVSLPSVVMWINRGVWVSRFYVIFSKVPTVLWIVLFPWSYNGTEGVHSVLDSPAPLPLCVYVCVVYCNSVVTPPL